MGDQRISIALEYSIYSSRKNDRQMTSYWCEKLRVFEKIAYVINSSPFPTLVKQPVAPTLVFNKLQWDARNIGTGSAEPTVAVLMRVT